MTAKKPTRRTNTNTGTSKYDDKFVVRMHGDLRQRLHDEAARLKISTNTLVNDLLEEGLKMRDDLAIQLEAVKLLRARLEATEVANA